ncbi:MAG: nucleotidyltransferase family protein, partial [Mycobacteriales bacterium]
MTDSGAGSSNGVAGLLLAAGAGERFGRPKAFAMLGGELLIDRALHGLLESGCSPVLAVVGAGIAEHPQWCPPAGVRVVENVDWRAGMGSSLRAGLRAAAQNGHDGVLVHLVDLPGIGAAVHRRVLAACRPGDLAVAASYSGRRGHPVLFCPEACEELLGQLGDETGARDWLSARAAAVRQVDCTDLGTPRDIDTREDLVAYVAKETYRAKEMPRRPRRCQG